MNFEPSEEQILLKRVAREFLDRESPPSHVREMAEHEPGFSPELWGKIAGLGWPALAVPERFGGQGGSLVDLAMLLEETGRVLLPSPFFATIALGAVPLSRASGPAQLLESVLPAVARGERLLTAAIQEPDSGYDPAAITTTVRDGRVNGVKAFVPDAAAADALLVLARGEEGRTAFFYVEGDAPGISFEPIPTVDWGRQYLVRFDRAPVVCEIDGLGADAVLELAAAALSAEMLGAAERTMELAVDWAKSRVQFGRPIGAFQAISHKCADMLVAVESARSLVWYAFVALDGRLPEATAAVSAAKSFLSDAFPRIAEACLQIHGGMGYTWESDVHLYLRKAKATEVRYGDGAWHRERLLAAIGW